tara:strand:- start:1130 stop:1849 length:720 start_codon:yes stop_codon:yes gene_type:complete
MTMKLIMENWRHYADEQKLIHEINTGTPVTYGMLKAFLKAIVGAKQGLEGESLANASGLLDFFTGGDAVDVAKMVGGLFENNTKDKQLLNEEPVTLALFLGSMKVLGAIGATKNLVGLGKKLWQKFKGDPTEKTDKMPFLDLFNLDPKYSEIVDDRIEQQFLRWWLDEMQSQADDAEVDTNDLDVNLKLQKFIQAEFQRELSGHTAPGLAGGASDIKTKTKQAKRMKTKQAARAATGIK